MKKRYNSPESSDSGNTIKFSIPEITYSDFCKGFYSDKYFLRTREILSHESRNERITQQFFAKKGAILCGMKYALEIIRNSSGNLHTLTVKALKDGERIEPWETVLLIEGPYGHFAHLETPVLGFPQQGNKSCHTGKRMCKSRKRSVSFFLCGSL